MDTKLVLIDCDGVLTDGRLHIDHTGEKHFKSFHTRDVRAIRELIYHGYEVVIVSADDWVGIDHFANKVGAEVRISRDKLDFIDRRYHAIGDDVWDCGMLRAAVRAFCPADADVSVQRIPGIKILSAKAGQGCIAEMIRELI